MRPFISNIMFCLAFLLMLSMSAAAMPAITCHCFTERSFNPSQPALADPYFLATIQNSFFAVLFNVDKKMIVMKKQKGISSDDLWIAYWVGMKAGLSAEGLLQTRQVKESWREVLSPFAIPGKVLGDLFIREMKGEGSSFRLAEMAVDELLLSKKLIGEAELRALRKAGATHQELIIALLIAGKTSQSATQHYFTVKKGQKSWGGLLQEAKIGSTQIQNEISAMLRDRTR